MAQFERSQSGEAWKQLGLEVVGARNELLRGAAVDFRDRLKPTDPRELQLSCHHSINI